MGRDTLEMVSLFSAGVTVRQDCGAETRNWEREVFLWGRGQARLAVVESETLGRVSSENDQWSVREMGINRERGTGHEL